MSAYPQIFPPLSSSTHSRTGTETIARQADISPRITVQGSVTNANNYNTPLYTRNTTATTTSSSSTTNRMNGAYSSLPLHEQETTNRMNGAYSSLPLHEQEADIRYATDDTASLIQNHTTTGTLSTQQIAHAQSSSANTQAQTVKYVCCGSCRQWLTAPVESRYVFCPTCEHVNACNQTPNVPTSTRPVYLQDNNDSERQTVPWLLLPVYDCMRGMLR